MINWQETLAFERFCLFICKPDTVKTLLASYFIFFLAAGLPLFAQEQLPDRVEALKAGKYSEKAFAEAKVLLPIVRADPQPEMLIDLLLWLSNYHIRAADYERAMELGTEAMSTVMLTDDVRRTAEVERCIGIIQYRTGDYERSIITFRSARDKYEALKDSFLIGRTEADIATNYFIFGKLDSAIQQLLLARTIMLAHGTPRDLLFTDQNLAIIYTQQGKPELGLPYTKQSLETILNEQDTSLFAPAYGTMAYTLQEFGAFELALTYYDSSLYYSRLLKQDANTYTTLYDVSEGYQNIGDDKNALKYFKEYTVLKDSVLNASTLNRIAELEIQHETARKKLALEVSEQKVLALEQEVLIRNHRSVIIAVGLFFSLLVAILIFLQWRKDIRHRETQKKLIDAELDNERLTSGQLSVRLENKQEDLTDFALDIERKNRFCKELSDRLQELEQKVPAQFRSQLNELIHFTESHDRLNEQLENVQGNIDQVNHEFYQKLTDAFPNLTSNDKALAGMLRLNMTNKEIATSRGISAASAKMARYRLRKKLMLEPDKDIHTFLREI